MKKGLFGGALALGIATLIPAGALSQDAENEAISEETTPAAEQPTAGETPEGEVPPVEVIQPAPEPEPEPEPVQAETEPEPRPAPRPTPAASPQPAPRPQATPVVDTAPPPPADFESLEPEEFDTPTLITQPLPGYYGPRSGEGAHERAMNSAQSPVNPLNGILPGNLQDFSEAGSRVTRQQINEQDPLSTNDIMQRVPGVTVVNDDGLARNGGIGIRGSNTQRGRKVLIMEDGQSINMSLYIDPSVHHTPPPDRIEAVEVIKGSIIYAPNNNYGAVNFRNIQPFGPNEFVMSGEGGAVALEDAGGDGSAAKWHVHSGLWL